MTANPTGSPRPIATPTLMSRTQTHDPTTRETDLDQLDREELTAAAEQYARDVQESYTDSPIANIELAHIDWKASSQLCRAGAYCETELDNPPVHTIVLSYLGYRAWDWERMTGVIRHELGHVVVNEQFEGEVRPHGPEFRDVAESLNAPMCGEVPIPYRYKLFCTQCGSMTDGLYQASNRTQNPQEHMSGCCHEPLQVETGEGWR